MIKYSLSKIIHNYTFEHLLYLLDSADRPHGQASIIPGNVTIPVGQPVTLRCQRPEIVGNPIASWFYWRRVDGHFAQNTTQPLSFTPRFVNESGWYHCRAENTLGHSDYSPNIFIDVTGDWKLHRDSRKQHS